MTSRIDGEPDLHEEADRESPMRRWRIITAFLALLAMAVILLWVPVPFVVSSPGPTFNVLGSANGEPMIAIEGTDPTTGEEVQLDDAQSASVTAKAKPGQGQLRMVTVSESGGPGNRLNFAQLLMAYFDSHSKIVDYESVYPSGTTYNEISDAQSAMMRNSQTTSQVAALEYLGWDVPATVTIEGATEGSNADGIVQQGDILQAITTPDGTRHEITHASLPFTLMRTVPAGSHMTLTIERDGVVRDVSFDSIAASATESGSKLGIYLSVTPELPVDISFNLDGVGGQWFLAPSDNCSEVVGHVPDGLRVVKVSNLSEAATAVATIAEGNGATLPTCQ